MKGKRVQCVSHGCLTNEGGDGHRFPKAAQGDRGGMVEDALHMPLRWVVSNFSGQYCIGAEVYLDVGKYKNRAAKCFNSC